MVKSTKKVRGQWKEANHRYNNKLNEWLNSGDPVLMEKAKKLRRSKQLSSRFSGCKSFIRNNATKPQISEIRDVIAERVKYLNKQEHKEK